MTTSTTEQMHLYHQPDWLCRDCRQAWPCGPGRERLREAFIGRPDDLREYMFQCWRRAVIDLRVFVDPQRGTLYTRFVGWAEDRARR